MNARSILKWTSLTAISLIAVFTLSAILQHDSAAAAIKKARQNNSGSLQVLGPDGKPNGLCPLKHTEVKAKVSGFLSRVTVTQDFENNLAEKIEAVYQFPLPEAAAVDDLTMVIGERVIRGQIMRREEAKATYTAAKQNGQIASLLDQEHANVFTQQVANILPGQSIHITISYVETLKYEEGSYEWTFPMVVAPRYVPTTSKQEFSNHAAPAIGDDTRAGHDISLEIDIDAGVPILAINSETHETEVQQVDEKHSVVRLKDRNTIPNKDFVLSYQVAGDTINDAVLAHRSERGGFFTLILQPPQRVAPADVMPKELVFVLDTSGSMAGFPIEKAKQTMQLALDTLYPHDTFNLITFAGETRILFPGPVAATPENLSKAKKFLSNLNGDGGTEMMQAIKAALEPSDSQYHVRLACFLTDGQVGNEAEILAEVQKHPNARVFAMGFGPAPNRSLLDKMSNYGRGEVSYISETGDTSGVARRFNERVRNPLLTDLSVEWSNLWITEVYPKHIPDLFAVKPLILSGRYSSGGKGTIRLKGKMAGQDFVREIPVELPETEEGNDVLANLWARRRIEDLVSEEIASVADQVTQDQKREEIIELGLKFKLMTQYTSFVAVDDKIFTGTDEPQRVDVPVEALPGSIASGVGGYVTITGGTTMSCVLVSSAPGSSTTAFRNLPFQGRSVEGLYALSPGFPMPTSGGVAQPARGSVAINGQSNYLAIDGVNANFGITAGGESPGISAAGNSPALTASGGANGLASLDAIEEVQIKTQAVEPEYGRVSGAQVSLITRSGSNEFHGSAFHFFGNDALDASDWFANARGLQQPAKRLNLFGGTFGGPVKRDHMFFFASYEGMRLRQPMTGITDVPSLEVRAAASPALSPFLNAFPIPNGGVRADGFAEFASTFANPARHDVGSFRWDHSITASTVIGARYNFADSDATQRGGNRFSLNTRNLVATHTQRITGSMSHTLSSTMILEFDANYSRSRVRGSYLLDEFGGAAVPSNLFPSPSFALDLNARNAGLMFADPVASVQRQVNLGGRLVKVLGNHEFKFGGDYRRLSPILGTRAIEDSVLFDGLGQALTATAARISRLNHVGPQTPVFNSLSLFAQDKWKLSPRLEVTYGLRWDLAPAPSSDRKALAVDQVNDPTNLNAKAPGSALWATRFANFAPRAGVAYELSKRSDRELLLRGGVGIFYDLGQDRSGDAFVDSIPFISGGSAFNAPLNSSLTTTALPLMAFDPQLRLPYAINWNVSLQQSLGYPNTITAAYVGSSGKRLLHTETLFDQNPQFPFLRLVTNRGESDYHALQLAFDRRVRDGLGVQVAYTWSKSLDNVTMDSTRAVIMTSANPALDHGPSDFDVRHQLTGSVTYELPAAFADGLGNRLSRNWVLDSIFLVRSARPLNVVYLFPTSIGVAYLRPDLLSGVSPYILNTNAPGGRALNSAAFLIPAALQQGGLGRNSLRGFDFAQVDLALHRKFNFSESVGLQIQADAFNLFNHPNFEDPLGNDLVLGSVFPATDSSSPNLAFGQSTSLAGRSLSGGGFGSFYNAGGARALRFSVKLLF